jgi:cellulose synthase/poly-beta-1,6-N-acetylglucosamine synthase-like glycosyltransferase
MNIAVASEVLAWTLLGITLPGTVYLAALSIAGALPARRAAGLAVGGRVAIVVPAHDEEHGIADTVDNLLAEAARDGAADVVVIADNCSDATARHARAAGARVIVRDEPARRGKGYALHHAFETLWPHGHAVFVVVDADSRVEPGFLPALRCRLGDGVQAAQARYGVLNAEDSARTRIADVALAAWNVLRPRGRDRLGVSAGILGNGFALRREVLAAVPYGAASVVEDLEYHLALVAADIPVGFADQATVRGEMPASGAAASAQRARWEGGRLQMLRRHAPGLVARVLRGQWRFLDPLTDLLLPPLAYQVALLLLGALAGLAAGSPAAALTGAILLLIVGAHVIVALPVAGLPWRRLLTLARTPWYLAWKLTRLGAVLRGARRNADWVRTARNPKSTGAQP